MKNSLLKLKNTKAEKVNNEAKVEFSVFSEELNFPFIAQAKSDGLILNQWMEENQDLVDTKLKIHGAILFRGFQVNTVDKFENFIQNLKVTPLEYKQRSSPRYAVANNIYHSTTYPADQSINMHSENSYAKKWANRIVFCCIQPAESGGETPIADNRRVVMSLSAETREKFLTKGVRYRRNMTKGIGLSWQEVFQTDEKSIVEEECKQNGTKFVWEGDDKLTLIWDNNAIYKHSETGEDIWFNHAYFFSKFALNSEALSTFDSDDDLPFNTFFGDGTEISKSEIEEIKQAYEKASVEFLWEKGDVLFMDNMMISHGRNPFIGDRKIIVSMY